MFLQSKLWATPSAWSLLSCLALFACSGSNQADPYPPASGGSAGSAQGGAGAGAGAAGAGAGGVAGSSRSTAGTGGILNQSGAGGSAGTPGGRDVIEKTSVNGLKTSIQRSGRTQGLVLENLWFGPGRTATAARFSAVVRNDSEDPSCIPGMRVVAKTATGERLTEDERMLSIFRASNYVWDSKAITCVKQGERGVFFGVDADLAEGKQLTDVASAQIELMAIPYPANAPPLSVATDDVKVEKVTDADTWRLTGKVSVGGAAKSVRVHAYPRNEQGFVFEHVISGAFDHSSGAGVDAFFTGTVETSFEDFLLFVDWEI